MHVLEPKKVSNSTKQLQLMDILKLKYEGGKRSSKIRGRGQEKRGRGRRKKNRFGRKETTNGRGSS